MRVLLVEDENVAAYMLNEKLVAEEIQVDWIKSGDQAFSFLSYDHYDVIVADLELSFCDGVTVIQQLRKQGVIVPILVFTHHNALHYKLTALDSGADDFLAKPFSFAELLARLQALTRRVSGRWTGQLEFEGLIYDPRERIISFEQKSVRLSKREGQMLALLARERGKAVARETILSHIWGPGEAMPNSADVLVGLLRKKLTALPAGIVIRTVRGIGYRLEKNSKDNLKS